MARMYQPTYLTPDDIAIDMEQDQDFECIVNGEMITNYTIDIYDDTGATVYQSSVTLSDNLYNGDTLSITVPSTSGCVNGNEYTWILTYGDGENNKISMEIPFTASSTPIMTITVPATITTFGYEFVGVYSQDEGVNIDNWYFQIYDSNDMIVSTTDISYSADIRHTFRGFEDGESYSIKGFGVTQDGQEFESTLYTFNVDYGLSSNIYLNSASYNSDYVANLIATNQVELEGFVTGNSSYASINYGGGVTSTSLVLDASATLSYDVSIPDSFTISFNKFFEAGYTGNILTIEESGVTKFTVGYDNTNFFYYMSDGIIIDNVEYTIASDKGYLITITPTSIYVKIFNINT